MPADGPGPGDPALREFLLRTSLFGCLDAQVVDHLLGMLRERRFAAGEVVFSEGDTGKSMYIVREGALIVKRHRPHGEARLLMMRPGDMVGVTTLIEMEPRPFSCTAEKDSVLLEL